ncbi:MAG TPA: hypothetical protein VGK99_13520 [Acidobacteriota bacterium]
MRKNRIALVFVFMMVCGICGTLVRAGGEQASPPQGTPSASSQPGSDRPLSPGAKFNYAVHHSILSPLAYAKSATLAGFSMAVDSEADRPYGMGAEGFGRRWADRMGRGTIKEFVGSGTAASLLHEDPRYFHSPNRAFGARVRYALTRVLITRTDGGTNRFNTHNVIGIFTAEGIAYSWRPDSSQRNVKNYFQRVGQTLAWDGLSKLLKEFRGKQ